MSLVDKLDAHIGDFVWLKGKEPQNNVTGFVKDYTPEKVTLSNTSLYITRTRGVEMRSQRYWDRVDNEKVSTHSLDRFDEYLVLNVINPEKDSE